MERVNVPTNDACSHDAEAVTSAVVEMLLEWGYPIDKPTEEKLLLYFVDLFSQ
jgi:hypothetical protein